MRIKKYQQNRNKRVPRVKAEEAKEEEAEKKMGNRLKYLRHGVPQYNPLTSLSNTHCFLWVVVGIQKTTAAIHSLTYHASGEYSK